MRNQNNKLKDAIDFLIGFGIFAMGVYGLVWLLKKLF